MTFATANQTSDRKEYTVTEISNTIKKSVEGNFPHIHVRGEISGFKRAASGHLYFSLKDEKSVLSGICWRGVASSLSFKPEDGLEVIATGKITTYPGRSNYQIVIDRMEVAGEGALMALLEKRKKQLAKEGLFDLERKKPLPYLPKVIGVVTSPTGAVIKDILHRLEDRFGVHVLLWPVLVQGNGAAEQIAHAINGLNNIEEDGSIPKPDLIIVARGGGSLEDLWAFNEEIVVRAVANSQIPLISAIGHETDTTLIDYVSDKRAPTPTAAAEIAVPVKADLIPLIYDAEKRLFAGITRKLDEQMNYLQAIYRSLLSPKQLMETMTQRLDDWSERFDSAFIRTIENKVNSLEMATIRPNIILTLINLNIQKVNSFAQLLESYHYKKVLERGFTIIRDDNGNVMNSVSSIKNGMILDVEFKDGRKTAIIASSNQANKKTVKNDNTDDSQGSLF